MHAGGYSDVAWGHHCTIEARIITAGTLLVFGIQAGALEGVDLRAKKTALLATTSEHLGELLQSNEAFAFEAVPGDLYVVPSGFLTAEAALTEVSGVRWSVSSDVPDCQRVAAMLHEVMNNFPEKRRMDKGLTSFAEYLDSAYSGIG